MRADSVEVVATLAKPTQKRSAGLGLAFDAYVKIPQDGDYNFAVDDAAHSMVFVHESRVVGETGPASDSVRLAAGWHPVRVYHRATKASRGDVGFTITDASGKNVLKARGAVAH